MNELENAYASLKLENERLRQDQHEANNQLTVARLALEQLTDGHKYSGKVCEIARGGLGISDEPHVLPSEGEMDAMIPEAALSLNAEFQRYSAMSSQEFAELAWEVLLNGTGTEHSVMVHELCSRASPEWARDVREAAKVDPNAVLRANV